jgi:hypothetical protein
MGNKDQITQSLSIGIFTIALSLVMPDIGIHRDKLNGVRRVPDKIIAAVY